MIHIDESEKQELMEVRDQNQKATENKPEVEKSKKRQMEEDKPEPEQGTSRPRSELEKKLAKIEEKATHEMHVKVAEFKKIRDEAQKELELERQRHAKEMEDYIDLRIKLKTSKLAFGIEPDKYLIGDLKQAAIYLGEFILPKIKTVVDSNREKFEALFLIGESFEHLPVKTCTLYNQNRDCKDSHFHKDMSNMSRAHCCTVCWEALWILE